jgi:bifunctional DNA-binding transcriptional regulator/antitoxin component of YhaV-PrlF toxin-antitoxin module
MATTIQLRSKGTLTIPSDVRERYAFEEGDVFSLVDLGDGSLLLVPRVSMVPKLVAEIEALRIEAGLSVEDMLADLPAIRQAVYRERYGDGG